MQSLSAPPLVGRARAAASGRLPRRGCRGPRRGGARRRRAGYRKGTPRRRRLARSGQARLHGAPRAADEIEHTRPFRALTQALVGSRDPDAAALVRVVSPAPRDAQRASTGTVPWYAVADAFVDVIERIAMSTPVVLALDDPQWADPSTLLVARNVVRRLTDVPVAFFGALRPLPHGAELARSIDAARDVRPPRGRTARGGRSLSADA